MDVEIKGTEEPTKGEISLAGLKEELRVVSQNLGNALDEISICRARGSEQDMRVVSLEKFVAELKCDNKQLSGRLESLGSVVEHNHTYEHMARMQPARAPMNPWGTAPTQPMPGGQIPYGPCFSHPVHPHGGCDTSPSLEEIAKRADCCRQLRDHKALDITVCDAIVKAVGDAYGDTGSTARLVHDIKCATERHLNSRN